MFKANNAALGLVSVLLLVLNLKRRVSNEESQCNLEFEFKATSPASSLAQFIAISVKGASSLLNFLPSNFLSSKTSNRLS